MLLDTSTCVASSMHENQTTFSKAELFDTILASNDGIFSVFSLVSYVCSMLTSICSENKARKVSNSLSGCAPDHRQLVARDVSVQSPVKNL